MANVPNSAEVQYQLAHASDNRSSEVMIVVTSVEILSMVFVGLRLFTRWISRLSYWYDDYVIVFAMIANQTSTLMAVLGPQFGLGRHEATILPASLSQYGQLLFAYEIGYDMTVAASKISVLLMYSRIFPVQRMKWPPSKMDNYSIAWWAVLFYVVGWWISFFCVTLFQCHPISYFWQQEAGGQCLGSSALYASGLLNIVGDLVVLCLPMRLVWKLQVKLSQKIAITGILLLGSFVCVTSIVRNYYVVRSNAHVDVTYSEVDSIVWSSVETCVGIICACLPTLGPLFFCCIGRSYHTAARSQMPTFSFSSFVPYKEPSNTEYANNAKFSSFE